jgi:hypothetical protein
MFLTEDTGRGLSRWFRGEASFKLQEACLLFGVASGPEFGVPPKDEKVTSVTMSLESPIVKRTRASSFINN